MSDTMSEGYVTKVCQKDMSDRMSQRYVRRFVANQNFATKISQTECQTDSQTGMS